MAKLEYRTDSDQILIYYDIKWAVYKIDLENLWKGNWTNVKKRQDVECWWTLTKNNNN